MINKELITENITIDHNMLQEIFKKLYGKAKYNKININQKLAWQIKANAIIVPVFLEVKTVECKNFKTNTVVKRLMVYKPKLALYASINMPAKNANP